MKIDATAVKRHKLVPILRFISIPQHKGRSLRNWWKRRPNATFSRMSVARGPLRQAARNPRP